jgi:hypothetical protein
MNTDQRQPGGRNRATTTRRVACALAVLASCCGGCERGLETDYAAVRGASLNGVAAFVQLLRDTGHGTTARQSLPARIDPDVRTVVVFDDSFTGLRPEAQDVLRAWTAAEGRHTLLLVLRDGDATVDYLRNVLEDDLPAERRDAARDLLARAEAALREATAEPRTATPPFFDGLEPAERSGSPEAAEVRVRGRDAPAASITARWELHRRLRSRASGQTLWESGGDRLLVRHRDDRVERLVLASAVPLLNGGLVDAGNRTLAEHLATLLPTDGKILVAGSADVAAGGEAGGADGEDGTADAGEEPSTWRLLAVQPLPWVALQATVALILFCWCTAPILGRPREVPATHAQDFGHHVDALAALFARSPVDGPAFARQRVAEWRAAAPPLLTRRPRSSPRKEPRHVL